MRKVQTDRPPVNAAGTPDGGAEAPQLLHGEALPPDVLQAKLDALREDLRSELARVVEEQNEALLRRHQALKPLLSIRDVAKTLGVSERTAETMLAGGELPPPLWIGKQRRWHPDSIAALIRSREVA